MAALPKLLNADLSRGFTVSQVAQKHGWPESMVWSLAMEGKELSWPVSSKGKADLVIFDPPYFDKKADGYDKKSISSLPKKEYYRVLQADM